MAENTTDGDARIDHENRNSVSLSPSRRTLVKSLAVGGGVTGFAGVAKSVDPSPQSHLTYVDVTETEGSGTDYLINISDGTSFSGTLNGSSDNHSFPSGEHCTGAQAQGSGTIEIEFSGGFSSNPGEWVYVEGIDYFRDGTNPSMPYSFTIDSINSWTCGLESSDSVNRTTGDDDAIGEVDPGDIDGYDTYGRFKSIHMDVKLSDKITVYRSGSWEC